MLKTKIKASSITNLTDARYFAAWEVEWLGFNLEAGNENFIPPRNVKAMKEWVDGVKIVGEFGLTTAGEVRSAVELMELDAVQLGMFADVELMTSLADLTSIKEVIIDKETGVELLESCLESYAPFCNYFLLNFDKNGISWSDLKEEKSNLKDGLISIAEQYPIILSINSSPEELDEILAIQPVGLNVKGGTEERVGFKSFDELDEIFEAIEILV